MKSLYRSVTTEGPSRLQVTASDARDAAALWYWSLAAIAFGVCFVWIHWLVRHGQEYPLTHDSAIYIDMARSLAAGLPPLTPPWGLEPIDATAIPQGVFPPGYSAILTLLSFAGFDIVTVAPWVNRIAAALIPLIILLLFRNVAALHVLFSVGVLVLTGTGLQGNQYYGLTDATCLALCVLSIGLLANSRGWRSALIAGLLGGFAYTIRNAALVLLITVPVWYAVLMVGKTYDRTIIMRGAVAWVAGAMIAAAPLLIYNIVTFGGVQPYSMPAAGVRLAGVAAMYVWAVLGEIFGAVGAGKAAYQPVSVFLLVCASVMLFVIPLAITRGLNRDRYSSSLLLLLFAIAGSALIIHVGSKYQGIAGDAHRYAMQYSWALLLVGGILLPPFLTSYSRLALVGLVVVFVAFRAVEFNRPRPEDAVSPYSVANDAALGAWTKRLHEQGRFLASDAAWIFRIAQVVPVRHLYTGGFGKCTKAEEEISRLNAISKSRPAAAILTKGPMNYCYAEWARNLENAGFAVTFDSPNAVIYSKDESSTSPRP